MIQAAFFDIDGTLVSFRTHTIPPSALEALEALRAKGVKLFLSTGRHRSMAAGVRALFPFDGMISANGQYCEADGGVLVREPLPADEVAAVARQLAQNPTYTCVFEEEDSLFYNRCDGAAEDFIRKLHLFGVPVDDPLRAVGRDVFQMVAFLPRERERLMLDLLPHCQGVRWTPEFMDVYGAAGGKERGIDAVCRHYGIPRANTIAFGDGENDISMLDRAGLAVAMGRASDAVRAHADYITRDVDEDGIRSALRHFGAI